MKCCTTASDRESSTKLWKSVRSKGRRQAEAVRKMVLAEALTIDDFLDEESLFAMLEPRNAGELAPCAVVDGEWLLRRAEKARWIPDREQRRPLALPRRQELERDEPEAFVSVRKLRSLRRGDDRICASLPLVCVSYIWHGPMHPDPCADQLLTLAESIVEARKVKRFPEGDFAVFLDWVSLHQRDENGKRTPQEKEAFRQALSKMNLWYAHVKTLVYLLTATPEAWPAATVPYGARGWPCFERMITMLLKHQSKQCWATICDTGAFAKGGSGRTRVYPPQPPEEFEKQLQQLTFTNGADRAMVLDLYCATLNTALGQARSLRYTGLQWGDEEMANLVKVLPFCRNLEYLNLKGSHNRYTSAAAELLTEVLSRPDVMPKLQMIGAGSREVNAEDQGPLLEHEQLVTVCDTRGVILLRDVPIEVVKQSNQSSNRTWIKSVLPVARRRTGTSRVRQRSSVAMTMLEFQRQLRIKAVSTTKEVAISKADGSTPNAPHKCKADRYSDSI